jgi:hypothetical protein
VHLAESRRSQQRLVGMPGQIGDRAGVRLGGAQQLTVEIPGAQLLPGGGDHTNY